MNYSLPESSRNRRRKLLLRPGAPSVDDPLRGSPYGPSEFPEVGPDPSSPEFWEAPTHEQPPPAVRAVPISAFEYVEPPAPVEASLIDVPPVVIVEDSPSQDDAARPDEYADWVFAESPDGPVDPPRLWDSPELDVIALRKHASPADPPEAWETPAAPVEPPVAWAPPGFALSPHRPEAPAPAPDAQPPHRASLPPLRTTARRIVQEIAHAVARGPFAATTADDAEWAPVRALWFGPDPVVWLFAGDRPSWEDSVDDLLLGEQFAWWLRTQAGRPGDIVIDATVGGSNWQELRDSFSERVLRFRPDVVFLMAGPRDAAAGLSALPRFERLVNAVISAARTVRAVPILNTPVGVERNDTDPDVDRLVYVEALRGLAREVSAPLIDHWVSEKRGHVSF